MKRFSVVLVAIMLLLSVGSAFAALSPDMMAITTSSWIPQSSAMPAVGATQLSSNLPRLALNARILRAPLLSKLGQQVEVQGQFYDGSIPMVVDDINRTLRDEIMPPDSYVPIVGPRPAGLKMGDSIKIMGTARKPTSADGKGVQTESLVVSLASSSQLQILSRSTLAVRPTLAISRLRVVVPLLSTKYAVLIAGGWDAANSHIRYWNDLKQMYAILRDSGYPAANIYVLYADGVAKDSGMPVNGMASVANINSTFAAIKAKTTSASTVYVMLNDHGSPNALCLWNHVAMSATSFANAVNQVTSYSKMIIQMKQCYSGSFVGPLTAPKRIVMSSSTPAQVSWAHAGAQWGEFTYWYMAAFLGHRVDSAAAVNADANGDGKVSILEAYKFAKTNDAASETPCYEDNGAAPYQTAMPPVGGDGTLGAATFLN